MRVTGDICVRTVMEALGIETLPAEASVRSSDWVELEVSADEDAIASELGLVTHEAARDELLAEFSPDMRDLRDGLVALRDGDQAMARILLCRAFQNLSEVERAVEESLRPQRSRDPRQPDLLAAA